MNRDWQQNIAAWQLAEAGRWAEALESARADPNLFTVLSQRSGKSVASGEPVIVGWQHYYRGEYASALDAFWEAIHTGHRGWLIAWAMLGIAKVASDSGWWKVSLEWCAAAWQMASLDEHIDLLAQIAGARGEILLRAGLPARAAAAFAEDRALLGPGNRYHGRIRCYEAHAWARMGANGRRAAALAYRLALHSAGEMSTAAYAAAGLALLSARNGEIGAVEGEYRSAPDGLPRFWVLISQARTTTDQDARLVLLEQAAIILPHIYYAEHWWLAGWSRAMGGKVSPVVDLTSVFPQSIPQVAERNWTPVEFPLAGHEIGNAPWWDAVPQDGHPEAWWNLRDCFMP